ncbi:PHP-associated domain-containing protein [Tundrisphaera lichenicola]|uniref:PHP-associated domain-containing protein n=1 Tax=Tundrisphaera lichenicola TaxID=2029860 RepID=UPI003EB79529
MAKIDHHVHTSRHSPDSDIKPEVLVERARLAGLDAVVITDHDYQWEPGELADLNAAADGLVVLSGVEVSALEGHFLVYGLPNLKDVEPGIPLADLLKIARAHTAAVVGAHPFRWDQDFTALVAAHGPAFDALELVSNNVSPETRSKTEALLKLHPMGATGSSDGHVPDAVGCYYTEFSGEVRSMSDFVEALRRKSGRPRHRAGAWQACGPVD